MSRTTSGTKMRQTYIAVLVMTITLLASAGIALAAPTDPFENDSTTSTTIPRETVSLPGGDDPLQLPPELAQHQVSADAAAQTLDALAIEMEKSSEAYNKAKEELGETELALADAQQELRKVTSDYRKRQKIYGDRLNRIYYDGGTVSFVEILLQTTSFADFISRINYIVMINNSDSTMVRLLETDKERVDMVNEELSKFKRKQEASQRIIESKQKDIQGMIAEQEAILAGFEDGIRQILSRNTEELREEQNQLLADLKEKTRQWPTSQLQAMFDQTSVVATALQYLGVKYVWGGENPDIGLDCSGLVLIVFRQHGVKVRHYSGWQFGDAPMKVEKEELIPGDLVFYGAPIHHVGIYIGDGFYINAPETGSVVRINSIERDDWAGAVRYPLRNKE